MRAVDSQIAEIGSNDLRAGATWRRNATAFYNGQDLGHSGAGRQQRLSRSAVDRGVEEGRAFNKDEELAGGGPPKNGLGACWGASRGLREAIFHAPNASPVGARHAAWRCLVHGHRR